MTHLEMKVHFLKELEWYIEEQLFKSQNDLINYYELCKNIIILITLVIRFWSMSSQSFLVLFYLLRWIIVIIS